ncbi:MAG: ribosome biogenesis GTPase Der [Sedimentisphaerales bacterium]|nr:ribosome biogenesis GTPase Der [Sedimentisphaerales bacterium]
MALPVVAIVGRPNVGKSSLLNTLAKRMISIVDPTAGVTRDRVSTIIEDKGRYYELVDTGGYGIEDHDNLTAHVENQIKQALARAQLALFVVDVREGVMPLDQQVAQLLRKQPFNVLLVANKADTPRMENMGGELYKLGFGEPLYVSALHGHNRDALAMEIVKRLADTVGEVPPDPVMHIAVVGKRNAGKSTFINSLAGEERVIVSEVPGITRDAIDVRIEKDGRSLVLIDTAGLRKKSKTVNDSIEFYSYTRATRSVRRADVVLFFIDATLEVSQVDKKLAHFIAEEHKPCILVVNKWDLAKDANVVTDDYANYFSKLLPGLGYAPICFITAKDGKNTQSVLDLAKELFKQATTEIPTGRLNKAIEIITHERVPSARKKIGRPKIYYGAQVATRPPTILLFVNNPNSMDENYRRFFINRLRDLLPFSEVPIRLLLRSHHDKTKNQTKQNGRNKG